MSKLRSQGAGIDGKTHSGQTALVAAAAAQQETSVKWLLTEGANANLSAKVGSLEAPPLWHAMLCSPSSFNFSVPLLLLKHGALESAPDPRLKRTPLHLAAQLGNLLGVALLLNAGADLKALDAESKTPLDYAEDGRIINLLKRAEPARSR
jgi:ankyrin repeat protein